jgi:uncharacterized damage-inducible protein DinB
VSASILPEFDMEMAKTRATLERVPVEKFDWKPHEKSFSFMQMANHLARIPGWGAATLTTESMDIDPEKGEFVPPPEVHTTEEVLSLFDQGVAQFRAALEGSGDEEMMKDWSLLQGGEELFKMPRAAVIRGMILNHIIHHRGQLTVYLRLNDLPVPALYGPSADEQGM